MYYVNIYYYENLVEQLDFDELELAEMFADNRKLDETYIGEGYRIEVEQDEITYCKACDF